MQAAMGDEANLELPNLDLYKFTPWPKPDFELEVKPMQEHVIGYNLCIKVVVDENQVESFHHAFCKWYLKLKEANQQTIIYLWEGTDHNEEALCIENPTDIPTLLPLLIENLSINSFCVQLEEPVTFKLFWKLR